MPDPIQNPVVQPESLKAKVKKIVPKEWDLTAIGVSEARKNVSLTCSSRPLEGFEGIFKAIHEATGFEASFSIRSVALIQDPELIKNIQNALPQDCVLVAIHWKPQPDFYALEIAGRKPEKEDLVGVRQIITRPLKVTGPCRSADRQLKQRERNAVVLAEAREEHREERVVDPNQIRITPFGACEQVGQSCFLFELAGSRILVDCGSQIGSPRPPALTLKDIKALDYVVLSHVHLDHSAMVPWLYAQGCRAPLITSPLGMQLLPILLHDSIRVNRLKGSGLPYTSTAIGKCLNYIQYLDFHEDLKINPEYTLNFLPAGHILGASLVHFKGPRSVLYSGDLSVSGTRSIPDAFSPPPADVLFLEATYGDREHSDRRESELKLLGMVEECCKRGGTVIIPSFAVGRAQEVLTILTESECLGRDKAFPVFVDGGLLQRANRAYLESIRTHGHYYGSLAKQLDYAINPDKGFSTCIHSHLRHDLLYDRRPKVIVTTSGMGMGPAQTHLRHFGGDPKNLVIFVGYQSPDSLGAMLLRGQRDITLDGDAFTIQCPVERIGFSGHADRNQLLNFVRVTQARTVLPIHGDRNAVHSLGDAITSEIEGCRTIYPERGTALDFSITPSGNDLSGGPVA